MATNSQRNGCTEVDTGKEPTPWHGWLVMILLDYGAGRRVTVHCHAVTLSFVCDRPWCASVNDENDK